MSLRIGRRREGTWIDPMELALRLPRKRKLRTIPVFPLRSLYMYLWLVVVALKSSLARLRHPLWCRQPRTHDRDGHPPSPRPVDIHVPYIHGAGGWVHKTRKRARARRRAGRAAAVSRQEQHRACAPEVLRVSRSIGAIMIACLFWQWFVPLSPLQTATVLACARTPSEGRRDQRNELRSRGRGPRTRCSILLHPRGRATIEPALRLSRHREKRCRRRGLCAAASLRRHTPRSGRARLAAVRHRSSARTASTRRGAASRTRRRSSSSCA